MNTEEAIAGLAHSILSFGQKLREMKVTHEQINPIKTRLRVSPKWTAAGALTEIGTIELEVGHSDISQAMNHIEQMFCNEGGELGELINIILIAKGNMPQERKEPKK